MYRISMVVVVTMDFEHELYENQAFPYIRMYSTKGWEQLRGDWMAWKMTVQAEVQHCAQLDRIGILFRVHWTYSSMHFRSTIFSIPVNIWPIQLNKLNQLITCLPITSASCIPSPASLWWCPPFFQIFRRSHLCTSSETAFPSVSDIC